MKLNEFYQETTGGTFTHDGKDYWLNPLLSQTRNFPVIDMPVNDLKWIIKYHKDDGRDFKGEEIDLSAPILIAKYEDKFAVIDGIHRLLKAVYLGKKTIPARYVDNQLLSYMEVDK